MDQDTDRRIRRTKRELRAALVELASKRPYTEIQVRDITDQADIGYATFYRHYENKDDLLLAVFTDITAGLETSAGETSEDYFRREGVLLFEHIQKYERFYRSILGSPAFVHQLKILLAQWTESHIITHAGHIRHAAFPIDLAANHMVAALIGLIEWWLRKDQPPPAEKMGEVYERLVIQATWYALDRDNPLPKPFSSPRDGYLS